MYLCMYCIIEFDIHTVDVYIYAKQKHLGYKKCKTNQKQHASRQARPKGISAEAKKLLYQKLLTP